LIKGACSSLEREGRWGKLDIGAGELNGEVIGSGKVDRDGA